MKAPAILNDYPLSEAWTQRDVIGASTQWNHEADTFKGCHGHFKKLIQDTLLTFVWLMFVFFYVLGLFFFISLACLLLCYFFAFNLVKHFAPR